MNIGILESKNFSENALKKLQTFGVVEKLDDWHKLNFVRKDIDTLFVRLQYYIGKEVLDYFPNVKIICTPTTGLNHIDLDYLQKKNINVISLKGETDFLQNVRATPEHTLGLILSIFRNYKLAFDYTVPVNRDNLRGREIYGTKFGLIGLGRVGNILANYIISMGGQVSYYDPYVDDGFIQRHSEIETLVKDSSCIVLCCSYSVKNERMITSQLLERMRDKFFVNTSRGELVDEIALLKLAQMNWFAGVAVDVISDENPKKLAETRRLLSAGDFGNVLVTPHMAGATNESMHKTEEFLVEMLNKRRLSQ